MIALWLLACADSSPEVVLSYDGQSHLIGIDLSTSLIFLICLLTTVVAQAGASKKTP